MARIHAPIFPQKSAAGPATEAHRPKLKDTTTTTGPHKGRDRTHLAALNVRRHILFQTMVCLNHHHSIPRIAHVMNAVTWSSVMLSSATNTGQCTMHIQWLLSYQYWTLMHHAHVCACSRACARSATNTDRYTRYNSCFSYQYSTLNTYVP